MALEGKLASLTSNYGNESLILCFQHILNRLDTSAQTIQEPFSVFPKADFDLEALLGARVAKVQHYSSNVIPPMVEQLLLGLKPLRACHLSHDDLHPKNVLLFRINPTQYILKICDLGQMSAWCHQGDLARVGTILQRCVVRTHLTKAIDVDRSQCGIDAAPMLDRTYD